MKGVHMAIRTKEEILNSISSIIGDSTDDASLGVLEDITDTLGDYETRVSDSTDWKTKYETNDAEWREKYKARFYETETDDDSKEIERREQPKVKTFEDLFTKGE